MDCSSFSISGGEGLKAGYKKDFITGQSTLSIGAGVGVSVGAKGMGLDLQAGENLYITFDGDGHLSDAGFGFDAGGTVKAGNISTGLGGGYTVGMNSGWNFTNNAGGISVSL